jgi:hypothetical protein
MRVGMITYSEPRALPWYVCAEMSASVSNSICFERILAPGGNAHAASGEGRTKIALRPSRANAVQRSSIALSSTLG